MLIDKNSQYDMYFNDMYPLLIFLNVSPYNTEISAQLNLFTIIFTQQTTNSSRIISHRAAWLKAFFANERHFHELPYI